MQNAGDFVDWVNMWLADNVPADDNDSELPPHDSVSDWKWERVVDHPSPPIQAEAETAALQVAAGLRKKKKHNLKELADQAEIAASTAKSAVRLSNDGHCAETA